MWSEKTQTVGGKLKGLWGIDEFQVNLKERCLQTLALTEKQ